VWADYTTSTGKIFHSYNRIGAGMPINGDYPFSWSVPPTDHGKNGCDNSSTCRGGGPTYPGEYTGSCTWCNGDTHSGGSPSKAGWNNTYYADTAIATDALERLALASAPNQTKPWFLAVGFRDPHLPWRYPGKFGDMYDGREVPYTNHSEVPDDPLAPMAWQYPLYFNGNYGDYWKLESEQHMQLSKEDIAVVCAETQQLCLWFCFQFPYFAFVPSLSWQIVYLFQSRNSAQTPSVRRAPRHITPPSPSPTVRLAVCWTLLAPSGTRCRKRLFAPFCTKSDHSTKTRSGQT
jgi:hypothetical protein